jgi:hypothetical protein
VATVGVGGGGSLVGINGVRTIIEIDLETKARALEDLEACGFE